jgi:hypothetical protein
MRRWLPKASCGSMASRESSCHFSGYPMPKYIVSTLRNAIARDSSESHGAATMRFLKAATTLSSTFCKRALLAGGK